MKSDSCSALLCWVRSGAITTCQWKDTSLKKKYRLANDSSLVTGWSCIYPWVKGKRKCLQEKEEDRKGYLGAEPVKVRVRQMLSLSGKVLPGIWKDFYFSPTLTHSDFGMCCAAEWCTPKTYASRTMNVCAQGKCYPCRRHFQLMEDAVSQLVQNYMTKWCTAWIQPNLNRSIFETKLNTWQFFLWQASSMWFWIRWNPW